MGDKRQQHTNKSKLFDRLKNVFGLRSSLPNSPQPVIAPPAVAEHPVSASLPAKAPFTVAAPPATATATPPATAASPSADMPPPATAIAAPPVFAPPPARSTTTDPAEAAELRATYTHFRILVIGRANAGKTTLLKRVCNTTEDPVYDDIRPTNDRGIHDVRRAFSFNSNPNFIFHDSPGFEAGGEKELRDVQSFIQEKAKSREVHDQIHMIWFCFTPDVSRPLLKLEQEFFNDHHAGNVPVVAIFTKFDDLITQVYDENIDEEANREAACAILIEKFEKPLRGFKNSPHAFVRFESIDEELGNHQEQVQELIHQTTESIDDLALKMLFVTVQQNNLEICIKYAVENINYGIIDSMDQLIRVAASWFGHCYWENHDYGEQDVRYGDGTLIDRLTFKTVLEISCEEEEELRRFVSCCGFSELSFNCYFFTFTLLLVLSVKMFSISQSLSISSIVCVDYQIPSMYALTAILICLEQSFWYAKGGIPVEDGFKMAWDSYVPTHQVKMALQLEQNFIFDGASDWFRPNCKPSKEHKTKYIKMILHNQLAHPDFSI